VPEHQGGFLLDGGMHYIAATRLILGDIKPTTLSAFTTLLKPHLPPADTLDSIWKTNGGISGSFAMSFGTTFSGNEYKVACEKGTVTVTGNTVTVYKGEEGDSNIILQHDFPDASVGVIGEVEAWAKGLEEEKQDPMQSPEQGLADLEILEMMMASSEKGGTPMTLQYRI
jgi:predicted dehydrogenase